MELSPTRTTAAAATATSNQTRRQQTLPAASLEQRQAKRRKLVQRDLGVRRVQDALEHVIVTGAKVRRDRWRRRRFRDREAHRGGGGDRVPDHPPRELTDPPPQKPTKRKGKAPSPSPCPAPSATKVCHAEDLRVYGKRYNRHLFPIGGVPHIATDHARNPRRRRRTRPRSSKDHNDATETDPPPRLGGGGGEPPNHKINLHNFDDDDSEWNFEHGDSIPPLLFRTARLSQEHPTAEQLEAFRTPIAVRSLSSYPNTPIGLEHSEVPRALIERCWERAVHIASNAMPAPVAAAAAAGSPDPLETTATAKDDGGDEMDAPTATRGGSGGSGVSESVDSSGPIDPRPIGKEASRKRCESLGIDLDSLRNRASSAKPAATMTMTITTTTTRPSAGEHEESSTEFSCPRCTRSFATPSALEGHFYGTNTTLGCCTPLVRPRHLALLRTLLRNYAESQTDLLWTVVQSQATIDPTITDTAVDSDDSDDTFGSYTNLRKNRQLSWRDVRRYMETAWNNSVVVPTKEASDHGSSSSSSSSSSTGNSSSTTTTTTTSDSDRESSSDHTSGSSGNGRKEKEKTGGTKEPGSSGSNNRKSNDPNKTSNSDSERNSDDTFGSYSDSTNEDDGSTNAENDDPTQREEDDINESSSKGGPERHPVQQSFYVSTARDTAIEEPHGGSGGGGSSSSISRKKSAGSGIGGSRDRHDNPPLMLNPMILEAVHRRLIDRYADVPY